MSARRVQGNFMLTNGYTVATGQAVESMDAVGYPAGTVIRAADVTWGTAHTAPSAPTLADAGVNVGTSLTNALTGVLVTAQFPWGEGIIGTPGTVTPTGGALIRCTLAALPTYALGWNIYVETAAASGVYKLWRGGFSGAAVAYIDGYGKGQVPYAANPGAVVVPTGALEMTQHAFARTFLGISNQRMATSGFFGTPTRPFGNSSDNEIMICRAGVFEFDCASATFVAGTYVGMAKDTGNTLTNQTVIAVKSPELAIGKVFNDGTSIVKVTVEVMSRFLTPAPTLDPVAQW